MCHGRTGPCAARSAARINIACSPAGPLPFSKIGTAGPATVCTAVHKDLVQFARLQVRFLQIRPPRAQPWSVRVFASTSVIEPE